MKLLQKLYQTLKQFILETLVQFKNLPTRIWRNLEETGEWLQNLLTGDDDTRDRLKEYFQWHGKEIFFCFLLAFLIAGVDKVQQFFDAFAQEIIQGGSSFDHFSLAFVGNGVVIFWLCYVFWHKPKRTTLLIGLFGKKRADNYRAYYQRKGNVWRVSATASIPLLLAGAGLAQSILKNESYRTPKEFVPKLAIAINAHPFITLMAVMLLFLILSLILAPRIRSNASLSNRHQTLWRNLFFMSLSILVLTWLFYHYQYQKGHVIYKGSALLLLVFWPPIMLTFLLNSFSDCLVKSSEILAEKQIEGAQTARRFNRVYDALMWSSYLFSGTALVLINIASVTTSAWFSMLVFPIAMLIFIAIVYYQAIDWLSYNMSRLRFSLLLGAMLGLMWFGPQKHYELKFKAPQQSQAVKRISLEDYFLAWLRDRVERGAIMRSDTIYLVSSEGGGSRSGAWTSAILTGLDQRMNGMFQERCLAISTVSGGSIGAATTLSLWDNAKILNIPPASLYGDDSTRTRYIHTIFKRNYISSSLAGLFFYDGFQQNILFSWLYPNSLSRTDRQQLEENDAMNRAFKAVFGVDKPLNSDYFLKSDFVGRYYVGQTETPRVDMPLFFPNTCRVEEGRRGVCSPVLLHTNSDASNGKNPGNPGLIDIVGELAKTEKSNQRISFSEATGLSQLFPFVNSTVVVDKSIGTFIDGGVYENMGLTTLYEVRAAVQKIIDQADTLKIGTHFTTVAQRDSFIQHMKSLTVALVIIYNTEHQPHSEPKILKRSTPLLDPITSLLQTPFGGHTDYIYHKIKMDFQQGPVYEFPLHKLRDFSRLKKYGIENIDPIVMSRWLSNQEMDTIMHAATVRIEESGIH